MMVFIPIDGWGKKEKKLNLIPQVIIVKISGKIIFQEMDELDLAHKSHLRYIIHHIENISDQAQKAADLLSGMAIKIMM